MMSKSGSSTSSSDFWRSPVVLSSAIALLAICAVLVIGFVLVANPAALAAGIALILLGSLSLLGAGLALLLRSSSPRRSTAASTDTSAVASSRTDNTGWSVAVWTAAFISLIAALVGALWVMDLGEFLMAELGLTLVIIASAVILTIGLAVTAVIMKRLQLTDGKHAMGLPEGSIRAIIALLLIVIFAVVATFLITNADRSSSERVIEGVTEEELEDYVGSVFSREVVEPDACNGTEPCYELRLTRAPSPSAEMSQQLLTTLGTLVVAVAAFYFGSQSVLASKNKEDLGDKIQGADGAGVDPDARRKPNGAQGQPPGAPIETQPGAEESDEAAAAMQGPPERRENKPPDAVR
jgi:hypothetical protein